MDSTHHKLAGAVIHSAPAMVDAPSIAPVETGPHRPWLAAILSFLFPGLGQAYAGQRQRSSDFRSPMVAVVLVVALFVTGVLEPPRNILLSTGFLGTVLVLNAAILLWRSAAIAHAGLWPWRELDERERLWTGLTVGVLLAPRSRCMSGSVWSSSSWKAR